jgi:hypothetical protein
VWLDEEAGVLKTLLRILYLGEATTRASSSPAVKQLLAMLGT